MRFSNCCAEGIYYTGGKAYCSKCEYTSEPLYCKDPDCGGVLSKKIKPDLFHETELFLCEECDSLYEKINLTNDFFKLIFKKYYYEKK